MKWIHNESWKAFQNTHYIVTAGCVSGLLIVIGSFANIYFHNKVILEFVTGLYLALTYLITGPMMLMCGIVAFCLINVIVGAIIYIPVTLIAIIWMFVIIKLLKLFLKQNIYSVIIIFALSSVMLFIYIYIYIFWTWLLFGINLATIEAITASNQVIDSVVIGTFLWWTINRTNVRSGYKLIPFSK